MADNWPFFLLSVEMYPQQGKSLPEAVVSHLAGNLDEQARLAVEGRKVGPDRLDPKTVLCTRWAATMEAA